jgi:hypothetical protein
LDPEITSPEIRSQRSASRIAPFVRIDTASLVTKRREQKHLHGDGRA